MRVMIEVVSALAVMAGVSAAATAALPRLVVQQYNSSNTLLSTTYDDTPGAVDTITLANATSRVNIWVEYSDPPESPVAVGHITFQAGGSPQSTIDFVVGKTAFSTGDTLVDTVDAMRCASWRGLTAPDSGSINCRLFGRLTGDLLGKDATTGVTMENIDQMSRLDVDGSMGGNLSIASPVGSFFGMEVGSISSLARIYLVSGSINRIMVGTNITAGASGRTDATIVTGAGNIVHVQAGGSIRADITARGTHGSSTQGRIGQIIAGGHIGRIYNTNEFGDPESSTAFPTLNPSVLNGPVLCIEASNGIDLVEADTMTCLIEADRTSHSGDAPGNLESVVTRTGSFKGLLKAQGLKDNDSSTGGAAVDIAGDFRGRVKLDDDPVPAPFYGLMKVRGSLQPLTLTVSGSPSVVNGFECHSNSFHGQIIVNAADDSESWTSAIKVGGTTISHTDGVYTISSASLGGGAVGLAPFPFYEVDCVPPNNELDPTDGILYSAFDDPSPVLLRWTGPIRMPTGEGLVPKDLVTIEVENPGTGGECQWIDLSTIFTVTLHPDGHERTLGIGAIVWPREGVYRVRYSNLAYNESKFFECAEVEGNPPVNFPEDRCEEEFFSYTFRILADCDNDDVSDLIQIAGNQSLDTNYNGYLDSCEFIDPCACDWNDNGVLEVIDIFDFLTDWFANEPAAINFGGASGVGAIFAYLNCWFAMACE